jgi:hypothetical protein
LNRLRNRDKGPFLSSRPKKVLRVGRSVNNCGCENDDLQAVPASRISGKHLLHTNRPQRIGAMTDLRSGATPLSDGLRFFPAFRYVAPAMRLKSGNK